MARFSLICFLFFTTLFANYPNKPIDLVVGFSKGGATYEMARVMKPFLEEQLQQEINIINMVGEGALHASNYVLTKDDGYTIYASTFAPYLANNILTKNADFKIQDFTMINLQWFDYDLFAVNKNSSINSIQDIIRKIKAYPKQIKAAVNKNSSGHLLLELILEKYDVPKRNLILKTYAGGELVRQALLKNEVDFIVVPAQGSESYREELKALAVNTTERTKRWDAKTLFEVLKDDNIQIPFLHGSMRGFAVPTSFTQKYPKRYEVLKKAFTKVLAKKRVQKELKRNRIGYFWLGQRHSNRLILESYNIFKTYNHLLEN